MSASLKSTWVASWWHAHRDTVADEFKLLQEHNPATACLSPSQETFGARTSAFLILQQRSPQETGQSDWFNGTLNGGATRQSVPIFMQMVVCPPFTSESVQMLILYQN